MLGSYDEAEDLVQETFLRAWRAYGDFEGRSSLRAWLYRIATNACIDVRRPRRVLPYHLEPASFPAVALPAREDVPWLQPFPTYCWTGRRSRMRSRSGGRRSSWRSWSRSSTCLRVSAPY
ncbi:sigma-70 family RNA polymerase sigma factor [Kribbella sp. NPDC023972]|uniref:sigma-70 family RNA polymerase sigma factor n=1 Tax=Kribbella sp. NPDC023972 TaxID=3154795 RepID=UPI0033C08901